MEEIVSLVRDRMHAEAEAAYSLLRQIPSTRATVYFDYLESISSVEREELLDAPARVTALALCSRRLRSRRFFNWSPRIRP